MGRPLAPARTLIPLRLACGPASETELRLWSGSEELSLGALRVLLSRLRAEGLPIVRLPQPGGFGLIFLLDAEPGQ